MSYWAFQADPTRYRLLAELVDRDETTWSVNQYANDIKVGDQVLVWLSGEHAGGYALAEVTSPVAEMPEDAALASYWANPSEASAVSKRVRLRYLRRQLLYPLLRKVALADPVLSKMLIVRRPAGTNFRVTDEEFKRIEELAAARPTAWARDETILALGLYYGLKEGMLSDRPSAVARLARLLGRTPDAVTMRLANFAHLDPDARAPGLGNVGSNERRIWDEFQGRSQEAQQRASEIEAKFLEGGGMSAIGGPTPATQRRYWKIAPGKQADHWDEARENGVVAIGWSEVGDATSFESREALAAKMREVLHYDEGSASSNAGQVWTFATEIKPGDIIVANRGKSNVVGRGEVIGPYVLRSDLQDYQNAVPVRWFDTEERTIPTQGGWVKTVIEIPEERYHELFPSRDDDSTPRKGIYDYLKASDLHFPKELVATYLLALKTKPFVILSGISGTGKTKLAQAVAEWAGTEERFVDEELVVGQTREDGAWLHELHPYNFKSGWFYIPRGRQAAFELPPKGTVPLPIYFGDERFEGSLGATEHTSGTMWLVRFRAALHARIKESFAPHDYLWFRLETEGEQQVLKMERVTKERRRRKETIRRYEFVSVRPDWLDGKEVLGFYNVLTERYESRPFLGLLLRAHRERAQPHFVILDEMNLARVEHYFSDLLSATESRTIKDGVLQQEGVHLHDKRQCVPLDAPDDWERPGRCAACKAAPEEIDGCPLYFDGVQLVPPRLKVRPNVYVTGTVNIDETTHMFSPKVLDRANVIEFNEVDLVGYDGDGDSGFFVLKGGEIELGVATLAQRSDFVGAPGIVRDTLIALNGVLAEFNLHFGYRVVNEVALFVKTAVQHVGPSAAGDALDLQVLQKVLPKLHGSKQTLMDPLWRLTLFAAFGPDVKGDLGEALLDQIATAVRKGEAMKPPGKETTVLIRLPRSTRKLVRMLRTLRARGFVSFIE